MVIIPSLLQHMGQYGEPFASNVYPLHSIYCQLQVVEGQISGFPFSLLFSFSFFYKLECWAHCKGGSFCRKALSKLLCEANVLQALIVDSLHGDPGPYLVID